MPQLLREIVRRKIARDSRFTLVGEYTGDVPLEEAIDRTRADYVIVASNLFEPSAVLARVVEQASQVKVLAIRPDGRQTTLYELRPSEVALGELSLDRLVEVIGGDGPAVRGGVGQ